MTENITQTKTCIRCKVEQEITAFTLNSQSADGRYVWCKTCKNAADRVRMAGKDPVKKAAAQRRRTLRSRYGIEPEDYEAMYERQDGRCAICRGKRPGAGKQFFCIDHDHKTGEVRGLLCWDCNVALGKFKDDPAILMKAAAYLEGTDDLSAW